MDDNEELERLFNLLVVVPSDLVVEKWIRVGESRGIRPFVEGFIILVRAQCLSKPLVHSVIDRLSQVLMRLQSPNIPKLSEEDNQSKFLPELGLARPSLISSNGVPEKCAHTRDKGKGVNQDAPKFPTTTKTCNTNGQATPKQHCATWTSEPCVSKPTISKSAAGRVLGVLEQESEEEYAGSNGKDAANMDHGRDLEEGHVCDFGDEGRFAFLPTAKKRSVVPRGLHDQKPDTLDKESLAHAITAIEDYTLYVAHIFSNTSGYEYKTALRFVKRALHAVQDTRRRNIWNQYVHEYFEEHPCAKGGEFSHLFLHMFGHC